jgi:hypothetical protein
MAADLGQLEQRRPASAALVSKPERRLDPDCLAWWCAWRWPLVVSIGKGAITGAHQWTEEIRIAAVVRVYPLWLGSEGTLHILPGERMAETQHGEVSRGCAITIDAKVFGMGTPILSVLSPFTTFALWSRRRAWHVPFDSALKIDSDEHHHREQPQTSQLTYHSGARHICADCRRICADCCVRYLDLLLHMGDVVVKRQRNWDPCGPEDDVPCLVLRQERDRLAADEKCQQIAAINRSLCTAGWGVLTLRTELWGGPTWCRKKSGGSDKVPLGVLRVVWALSSKVWVSIAVLGGGAVRPSTESADEATPTGNASGTAAADGAKADIANAVRLTRWISMGVIVHHRPIIRLAPTPLGLRVM